MNAKKPSLPKSPSWRLLLALGVGAAPTLALVGSLLLLTGCLAKSDPASNEVASTDAADSYATTSAETTMSPRADGPQTDHAAQTAAAPPDEAPASDSTARENDATAQEPPPATMEISFDDVPVIGAAPDVPAAEAADNNAGPEDAEVAEKLNVPFYVLGCSPSTDGRLGVVWGYDGQTEPASRPRGGSSRPSQTRLALLDLATRKILAERKIAAAITQVDFNATGVYVAADENATESEMTVLRLSSEDLKTLARATILRGTITSVADRFLISERPKDRESRKYLLPSLTAATPDGTPMNRRALRADSQPARRLADGWLLKGVLWDDELKKPKLLLSPPAFVKGWMGARPTSSIVAVPILQGYVTHVPSGASPIPHDRRVERPRYSPHVPAVLTLRGSRGKRYLDFSDHALSKVVRSVTLGVGSSMDNAQVATSPDWIVITLNGETLIVPTGSAKAPLAIPFRIEPRQSELVLSTTMPNHVSYQARGATKFEFEMPGLKTDGGYLKQQSRTGEFTLDLATAVPVLVESINEAGKRDGRALGGDPAAWAGTCVEKTRDEFLRLIGREPDGVPLMLDAYVRAYGTDLSVAVLHHDYLLELPVGEFEKYRRKPVSPESARREAAARSAPARTPRQPPPKAATPGSARTWTDTQGRTLEAKFVRVEGGVVVVVDQRQRTLRLPLDRLSEEDRVWAAQQAAKQPQPSGVDQ